MCFAQEPPPFAPAAYAPPEDRLTDYFRSYIDPVEQRVKGDVRFKLYACPEYFTKANLSALADWMERIRGQLDADTGAPLYSSVRLAYWVFAFGHLRSRPVNVSSSEPVIEETNVSYLLEIRATPARGT